MSAADCDATDCRHCGLSITRHEGIGGVQWRDNSHHSPSTCFKARNLVHEPEPHAEEGDPANRVEGEKPCEDCGGGAARCIYYACREPQDGRHDRWWCEFGTCSRAHAIDHYGEEVI